MIKYRVVLIAEDGFTVLKDGINSALIAAQKADNLERHYGEGQRVIVEEYMAR